MRKMLVATTLSIILLNAGGLESFLNTENNDILDKKEIKYKKIYLKIEKLKYNGTVSSYNAEAFQRGVEDIQDRKNKYNQYEQNENERYLKKLENQNIETTVLKYFNAPNNIKRLDINEKIIVSFDVDRKGNINNIIFKKESQYYKLNKEIKNAIKKASEEIERPEKKTTHTLYYHFLVSS